MSVSLLYCEDCPEMFVGRTSREATVRWAAHHHEQHAKEES